MAVFFLDQINKKHKDVGALALGGFDGVHLGHEKLIKEAVKHSKNLCPCVVTFNPHPKVFFKTKCFKEIFNLQENAKRILEQGAKRVYVKTFNKECSEMTAQEFLDFLYLKLSFKALVVGFDFKLGKNRSEGANEIREWCSSRGIEFVQVNQVNFEGKKASSTRVRELLEQGNVGEVNKILTRPYSLSGFPVRNTGLGTQLGFPTVNLKVPQDILIKQGVYATQFICGGRELKSVSNLGRRPTVESLGSNFVFLETHVLDKSIQVDERDCVRVEFLKYLRPEQKFGSVMELKEQVQRDCDQANIFFKSY